LVDLKDDFIGNGSSLPSNPYASTTLTAGNNNQGLRKDDATIKQHTQNNSKLG